MIDLYTAPTPNGKKVSIMLEETGLPYQVHPIALSKLEQKSPEFLAINPNGKIPAIVDQDGPGGQPLRVFESGSILIYLAEKSGQLLPGDLRGRTEVISWVMFQVAGIGPMFGELGHFRRTAPEKIPYAIERFTEQQKRLLSVLETRLTGREFLADQYSIADIACYPWVAGLLLPLIMAVAGDVLASYPGVRAWVDRIAARPAVQRGMAIPPG